MDDLAPLVDHETSKAAFCEDAFNQWYVLAVFSYSAALQALLWLTFSSVPAYSKQYLSCGDNQLDFLLNEGPIAYCIVVLFASWLLARHNGLRNSVLLGIWLCFVAALLRCIPTFASSLKASASLWFIYVAQFLNAAAAPFTQAGPSLVSQVWFHPTQRNTVTAIARGSNALGRAVGFYLGPAVVSRAEQLPHLLYITVGLAIFPVIAGLVRLPNAPNAPPSRSAAMTDKTGHNDSILHVLLDWCGLLRSPNRCALLVLAFGLQMGAYGAWTGVLPLVLQGRCASLSLYFQDYTQAPLPQMLSVSLSQALQGRCVPLSASPLRVNLSLSGSLSLSLKQYHKGGAHLSVPLL